MQQSSGSITIDLVNNYLVGPSDFEEFFQKYGEPGSVLLKTDGTIQLDQVRLLWDACVQKKITPVGCAEFCRLIALQGCYSDVEFRKNESGILCISLSRRWLLKKIKIHGLLRGKQRIAQLYMLEPGQEFNYVRHCHAIKKIKNYLYGQGYLDACVSSRFERDLKNKLITVHITPEFKDHYTVESARIEITGEGIKDLSKIGQKCQKHCLYTIKGVGYTRELVNQLGVKIKDYLSKKGYFGASIRFAVEPSLRSTKLNLLFAIHLSQRRGFEFFGNRFFKNDDLSAYLKDLGGGVAVLPMEGLAEHIAQIYKQEGFFDVCVVPEAVGDRIYFKIKEGVRALISRIYIKGTSQTRCLKQAKIGNQLLGKTYNEREVKKMLMRLTGWYANHGFLDCSVVHYECKKESSGHCLEVILHEGERWLCNTVILSSDGLRDEVLESSLDELVKRQFGQISCGNSVQEFELALNPTLLAAQKALILDHYRKQGYLYARAHVEFVKAEKRSIVRWNITGVQSPVFCGKLVIVGASSYSYQKILKELAWQEGDLWDREKIEQGLARLRRWGIFETVSLTPCSDSHEARFQEALLKLCDDDPFELRVRAGVAQVSKYFTPRAGTTYKAGASLLCKNPGNSADCLRFDTDFTRFYRTLSSVYTRPLASGMPLWLTLKGYSNRYVQPTRLGKLTPLYHLAQEGILCGLSCWQQKLSYGAHVGVEWMETSDLTPAQALALNFEPLLADRLIPYIYCEPSILIDNLDDKVDPRHGSLTAASFKTMIPWERASESFTKMLIEHSLFVPLRPSLICALRLRVGHVFNRNFSRIMPSERFLLGGAHSLRSYEPDQAPPLGLFVDDDGKSHLVPQGGRSMLQASCEFRIILTGYFGCVIFTDVGSLMQRSLTQVVQGAHLLVATGFGLRYTTPVGPLRFDVGFKWKKDFPEQSPLAWFLTLGHAF